MERRANGEGTIKKRPDGYYAVSLSDGTDADGKRIRHQATCKTRKEAVAKLEGWKAGKRDHIDLKKGNMTVATLIEKWMANCRPRLRPTTLYSYEQLVRLHLLPALGNIKVVKVNAMMLDDFFAEKRAAGLGASTLSYLRRLLHAIFQQAMDYDIVPRNVVKRTTAIEKSNFTAKFLTEAQAQALVSVLPSTVYGLYTLVCLTLGMRPAEVRGLRWSDVELHSTGGGTIHVRQQIKDLRGVGGGYSVQPPKTDKGIRPIPIPASVVGKLCEHQHQQEADRMAVHEAGLSELLPTEWADLVFRGEGGLPLNERYIRRKFKEFLAAAGLDSTMRLYDLRHTNNALLAAMGTGAEVRRDLLGHSTTLITLDVYGHAMPHSKVEAMGKMDDLLTAKR